MASIPPELELRPLNGGTRTAAEQLTMFHLVFAVIDPYTYESSWILETAARILTNFFGADCRVAWLVTGDEKAAREFLGPLAESILTFVDPDREVVKALEISELPAFVHISQDLSIEASAQGWDPAEWREVAENLAEKMSWTRPVIPVDGDPVGYPGTPALS
ncbi:MAG: hypothetical protein EDR02_15055 [Actinobacteria bacterium]|nr:MAG: hypothetical protein EDR02_15055 [Actinomycetota bacterium]